MKINKLTGFLIIGVFLINMCSSAQRCPPLGGGLIDREAEGRRDFFERTKKKKIWEDKLKINIDDFKYDKKILVDVLTRISNIDLCDGMRLYFALSDKKVGEFKKNKLYLVFVPTIETGEQDDRRDYISRDSEDSMYIALEDTIISAESGNRQYVYKSIAKYLNKILTVEDMFEKTYKIPLKETHSLWFSKEVLFDSRRSLLNILQNRACNYIEVGIDFASWNINTRYDEYSFKTDILFELIEAGGKSDYLTTVIPEAKADLAKLDEKLNDSKGNKIMEENKIDLFIQNRYGDTAIPCPPAKCPD